MKKLQPNTRTLDEMLNEHYGKPGTPSRDEFERGFNNFKISFSIKNARLEQGLTQQELADKADTNKAYISRAENDIKDVRLSTLRKIVEVGLGGELELSIKL